MANAANEETSWTTPIVVEHAGKAEVITAATRRIRSYDLASGKLLWECAGLTTNAIPTPVAGKELIYATTGFRGKVMLAIRPGGTGDITGTDAIAWTLKKGTPYVPTPLLYDDRLYFFSGNTAVLSCVDANSGHPLYEEQRIAGLQGVYASPVGGGGRVYLVGRNGATVVIKNSDKLEIWPRTSSTNGSTPRRPSRAMRFSCAGMNTCIVSPANNRTGGDGRMRTITKLPFVALVLFCLLPAVVRADGMRSGGLPIKCWSSTTPTVRFPNRSPLITRANGRAECLVGKMSRFRVEPRQRNHFGSRLQAGD